MEKADVLVTKKVESMFVSCVDTEISLISDFQCETPYVLTIGGNKYFVDKDYLLTLRKKIKKVVKAASRF